MQDGFGKKIALNRVLVANAECNGANRFLVPVALVDDLGWCACRCVEWDQNLYASARAENVDALIFGHLRGAGECCHPSGKIHHAGKDPVSAELRIKVGKSADADRLGIKQEAGQRDRVASDVHESAAAYFGFVADVVGVIVVIGKKDWTVISSPISPASTRRFASTH